MRNLSYRETFVSLVLIAAASLAAYRLWFAPALAQTERDRATIERLLVTLAVRPTVARTAPQAPAAQATVPEVSTQPLSPPVRSKPTHAGRAARARRTSSSIELACADDSKDPLCGALTP